MELETKARYSTLSNLKILSHLNLPRFLLICTSKWLNKYRRKNMKLRCFIIIFVIYLSIIYVRVRRLDDAASPVIDELCNIKVLQRFLFLIKLWYSMYIH